VVVWYDDSMKKVEVNCAAYSIAADLYENGTDKIMLVLPGWLSNKANYESLISFVVDEAQTSAVVIDYSGHGESPFDAMNIRPAQHFLEVITAFDWIREKYPNAQVSVMGTSYGGYMAVQLTKYRDFGNLVLRVPAILAPRSFYSLNGDIHRQQERHWRSDQEFLNTHPLLARASKFNGRTLVVWHELDESVPRQTTDKYIEIFKADNYLAKGWGHSFKTDASEAEQLAYKRAITDWLNGAGPSTDR
jgi:pimeloyl-ACP methyl ester carboxylesterase